MFPLAKGMRTHLISALALAHPVCTLQRRHYLHCANPVYSLHTPYSVSWSQKIVVEGRVNSSVQTALPHLTSISGSLPTLTVWSTT